MQLRVLRKSARQLGDVALDITADTVRARDEHASSEAKWSRYGGYLENDAVFAIYEESPSSRLLIVPKRTFQRKETANVLRRILVQRFP
jgi:hypothetical protein